MLHRIASTYLVVTPATLDPAAGAAGAGKTQ